MKTPDPQLRQEMLDRNHKPYEDAFNIDLLSDINWASKVREAAASLAAFYTEDAVLLPPETGPVYGREAIEKWYADLFTQYYASNFIGRPDQYSPHIIGTSGNELWSNGDWSVTLKANSGDDSMQLTGKWSCVYLREDNAWKAQMHIWNVAPEPASPA
jgi:ketosteroid isomerase-like protein